MLGYKAKKRLDNGDPFILKYNNAHEVFLWGYLKFDPSV